MAGITEDLDLNIAPALAAVSNLDSALTSGAASFGDALGASIADALARIDTSSLSGLLADAFGNQSITPAIDTSALSETITPQVDTSGITDDIDSAIAAADTSSVDFSNVDASPVTDSIDAAVNAADTGTIDFAEVNAAPVTEAIDNAVTSADTQVTFDNVDTTGITDAIDTALSSVDTSNIGGGSEGGGGGIGGGLSEQLGGAAEGALGFETVSKGLESTNQALEGSFGGLASAIGPVGGVIAGTGAAMGTFFKEALDDQESLHQLNLTFGDAASSIENVNLPASNFSLSLEEIAKQTGASLPALEQANANIGRFGQSAGASAPQIQQTANQITAIASYLAVMNPSLGSASTIADQLTLALGRGGRALASLGLSATTQQIGAMAQGIAGAGNQVTQFDKTAAGAQIVVDSLGSSLGTKFSANVNEAALAFPKFEESLKETIAAVGQPLIAPIVADLTAIGPVLAQTATLIGQVLGSIGPSISTALQVVGPVISEILSLVSGLLKALDDGKPVILAFGAALAATKVIGFVDGLVTANAAMAAFAGEEGLVGAATAALTAEVGLLDLSMGQLAAVAAAGVGSFELTKAALTDLLPHESTSDVQAFAQAVAGVTNQTDLSKESAGQLSQQISAVSASLGATTAKLNDLSNASFIIGRFTGSTRDLQAQQKALEDEFKTLTDAFNTNQAAAIQSGAAFGTASQDAAAFTSSLQTVASKLNGVEDALNSVTSTYNSEVASATKALSDTSTVFSAVTSTLQTTTKSSGTSALSTATTDAKALRDALLQVSQAQQAFDTLAAGPTAQQVEAAQITVAQGVDGVYTAQLNLNQARQAYNTLATGPSQQQIIEGELSIQQAVENVATAQQKVVDAQNALNAITAGPSPDSVAQAQESIGKATISRTQASEQLSDAQKNLAALDASGSATARQLTDAHDAVQTATYALADANRQLATTQQALINLQDESKPGSAALLSAQSNLTTAQLDLAHAEDTEASARQAQNTLVTQAIPGSQQLADAKEKVTAAEIALQQATISESNALAAQSKLFSDALPGSDAYQSALNKLLDAQGALQQAQTKSASGGGGAPASSTKTLSPTDTTGIVAALQSTYDQQIAQERQFFADLQAISANGGALLVQQLLSQGPQQGAAEAAAIASATPTAVQALETRAQTLQDLSATEAGKIGTIYGQQLTANLLQQLQFQLTAQANFFSNVNALQAAGYSSLAQSVLSQAQSQGVAAVAGTAQALATASPQILAQLNTSEQQLSGAGTAGGKVLAGSLATSLTSGFASQVSPALLNGITALNNSTNSKVASDQGKGLASSIIDGIGKGFADIGSIPSRAAGLVSELVGGFKHLLGISSPSQVMADEVGAPMLEGIFLGLERESPVLATTINDLVTELTTGVTAPGNDFHSLGRSIPLQIAAGISSNASVLTTSLSSLVATSSSLAGSALNIPPVTVVSPAAPGALQPSGAALGPQAPAGPVVNNHIEVHEAGNAQATALAVTSQIAQKMVR